MQVLVTPVKSCQKKIKKKYLGTCWETYARKISSNSVDPENFKALKWLSDIGQWSSTILKNNKNYEEKRKNNIRKMK